MTAAMNDKPTPEPALGYWEDEPVWGAEVVARGLEGGLRKSVNIEPVLIRRRQRVTLVVDCYSEEISFVPTEGPDKLPGVNRHATLKVGLVTIIDRSLVAKALDEQQRKIDEAEARKAMFDLDNKPTADALPGEAGDNEEPLNEAEAKAAKMFGIDGGKAGRRSRKA